MWQRAGREHGATPQTWGQSTIPAARRRRLRRRLLAAGRAHAGQVRLPARRPRDGGARARANPDLLWRIMAVTSTTEGRFTLGRRRTIRSAPPILCRLSIGMPAEGESATAMSISSSIARTRFLRGRDAASAGEMLLPRARCFFHGRRSSPSSRPVPARATVLPRGRPPSTAGRPPSPAGDRLPARMTCFPLGRPPFPMSDRLPPRTTVFPRRRPCSPMSDRLSPRATAIRANQRPFAGA